MRFELQYAWPTSSDPLRAMKWQAIAYMLVGALLGYITHPLVWLVGGPVRWVCLMMMTASAESAFHPAASGDDGQSIGILQFNVGNDSIALEKRTDPFASGYAAAVNVQAAIWKRPLWAPYIWAPVIGPAWFRALWFGPATIETMSTRTAWERFTRPEFPRAWSAWWVWRVLTFPFAVAFTFAVVPLLAALPVVSVVAKPASAALSKLRKRVRRWV